jgi:hypothetical protein
MLPSDAKPRPPADFASLLETKEPMLLVGGQAVNLWALYYRDRTSDLAPFVSRDTDVLGDRETLTELGKLLGVKPRFFPLRPPSNEVGVVIAKDSEGMPLLIEVLRNVMGVTNEELRELVYKIAVGEKPVLVQIPGPIALLKAKIANVATIDQAGRQDARHVVILTRILPAYLGDLQAAVISGELSERKLLEFLEKLVAIVTDESARGIFARMRLNRAILFSELSGERLPKLGGFLGNRLPRALLD